MNNYRVYGQGIELEYRRLISFRRSNEFVIDACWKAFFYKTNRIK